MFLPMYVSEGKTVLVSTEGDRQCRENTDPHKDLCRKTHGGVIHNNEWNNPKLGTTPKSINYG